MWAENVRFFRSQASLMQQPAAAGVSTEPDGAGAPPHTAALPQTQTRSASQSRSAWTSSDADLPKGQEISTNSTLAFGTSKEGTTSNLIMTTKKLQQHQGFIMAEWFPLFSLFFFLKDFSLSTPQSVIYIYYRDIEQILLSWFGAFWNKTVIKYFVSLYWKHFHLWLGT